MLKDAFILMHNIISPILFLYKRLNPVISSDLLKNIWQELDTF